MIAKQIKITSLQHPLVKHWVKLRQERSYREENQTVLVVGKKMVEEISRVYPISRLISSEEKNRFSAAESFFVSPEIMKKITNLEEPEGVAAEFSLPQKEFPLNPQKILVLDGLSDPGNLGTLLRTALGLGWDGVFLTPHTVDPWNEKALRAAKGATFFLPIKTVEQKELLEMVQTKKFHGYVADMGGKNVKECQFEAPFLLILSHESKGKAPWTESCIPIGIPLDPGVDSLNVAISGGILLYLLKNVPY